MRYVHSHINALLHYNTTYTKIFKIQVGMSLVPGQNVL